MKWFSRFLTLCSLTAVIAIPLYMSKTGSIPFLGGSSGSGSSGSSILSVGKPAEKLVVRKVYKWQDASGAWQYSDVPPPEGTDVATLTVTNQTNIIQSVPVEKSTPELTGTTSAKDNISEKSKKTLEEAEEKELISLDRVENILGEAKAVQELMNSRNQQLDNITQGKGN